MRRTRSGFLIVELAIATAIFGSLLLVIIVFLKCGANLVRQQEERITASSSACALLDDVRHARVAVQPGGTVELPGPHDLAHSVSAIEVKPWGADDRLCQVTVRSKWTSYGGRPSSLALGTLVRKDRLKIAGARP